MSSDRQTPLPATVLSAAELNPYAAPAEAGGYDTQAAVGIGVWRDGKLTVMHRAAPFPPVCIHTGQPATRYRRYGLLWSYPIDWSTRRLYLNLPLCETAYKNYRARWWIGALAVVLPLFIMYYGLAANRQQLPDWLTMLLGILTPVGVIVWATLRWWDGKPLKFVRVRDNYFWLSGADERFLAQLPQWSAGT
jgi:hypothetical protein